MIMNENMKKVDNKCFPKLVKNKIRKCTFSKIFGRWILKYIISQHEKNNSAQARTLEMKMLWQNAPVKNRDNGSNRIVINKISNTTFYRSL